MCFLSFLNLAAPSLLWLTPLAAAQGAPTWRPDLAPAIPPDHVQSMIVFDDGSGPALVGVGLFPTPNTSEWHVARWDGGSWELLGGSFPMTLESSLAVFDDGTGPALYVGWRTSSGTSTDSVARWNGTSWESIGNGQIGEVLALEVFDDGSGPALYAGGLFHTGAGHVADHVARWDGTSWESLGSGVDGVVVQALEVFDDGRGPALYAGGSFTTAGGVAARNIARWDGASWEALGSGRNNPVTALQSLPSDGISPARLCATGNWVTAWDGDSWSVLGTTNFFVSTLGLFDDGAGGGLQLYAGGSFTLIGGVPANRIARFDGATWHALENGVDVMPNAMTVFDEGDGTGPALYVANDAEIARWQGLPDGDAPEILCPPAITEIDAFPGPGKHVDFEVEFHDRDPNATLVCVPPSGSLFPVGTTPVFCTATDASGNQSSCTFLVKVSPKLRRR